MTEAGMPVTPKDLRAMANVLQSIIAEDKKLHLKYYRNPEAAVKIAFERFTKSFTTSSKRKDAASIQRDKEALKKLPKTPPTSGSAPSPDRTGEPKNLAEAATRAKEFFAQFNT